MMMAISAMRALGMAGAIVLLSVGAASAQAWTSESAQGITEYRVDNAQGDTFTLSCDVEASKTGGEGTAILVTIGGKDPEPGAAVKVILDTETLVLQADQASMIGTECAACSQRFKTLWNKLRTAKTMRVQLGTGAPASFSLDGAAAVLPATPCKTGFNG
jgi:hypothetical protein